MGLPSVLASLACACMVGVAFEANGPHSGQGLGVE